MKQALFAILALMFGLSSTALSQPNTLKQFQDKIELLENPGFENGKAGWTASAGSFTLITSSSALAGSTSARFNASASGQIVYSKSYTVPKGLWGLPCLGYVKYITTESTNKYRIRAYDGSNVLAYNDIEASSTAQMAYVPFTCPSSGTVRLEIYSQGDAADIDFDFGHLGSDTRLVDVSQAQALIRIEYGAGTAAAGWNDINGTGTVQFGDAAIYNDSTKYVTLPQDGRYLIVASVGFSTSTVNTAAGIKVNGTLQNANTITAAHSADTGALQTTYLLDLTKGTTIKLAHYSSTSSTSVIAGSSLNIVRFPSGVEQGVRIDQLGWRVDANISGGNVSLGTAAVTSYSPVQLATYTLTNNTGNGVIAAQIPCASGTSPSGTTCSGVDEQNGVSFNAPSAGDVLACASFSWQGSTGASGSVTPAFQIVETAANATTILQEGKSRMDASVGTPSNTHEFPLRVCGTFSFASAGQKTLRLFYEQFVAGTVTGSLIIGDANTNIGQRDIHWEVYPINYLSGALPMFKGMVTSNTSGKERVERVAFGGASATLASPTNCTSTPCTIISQSGSWISSVTRSGTGQYLVNIAAGTFSSAPNCTIQGDRVGSGPAVANIYSASTSQLGISSITPNTLAVADSYLSLICMGQN
jgi:hypothetical protein